jgi:hypothetical protein
VRKLGKSGLPMAGSIYCKVCGQRGITTLCYRCLKWSRAYASLIAARSSMNLLLGSRHD